MDLEAKLVELSADLPSVDVEFLLKRVLDGINGINQVKNDELLTLTAETAASLVTQHPQYSTIAGRLLCEELYQRTPNTFSRYVELNSEVLAPEFVEFVQLNADVLNKAICEKEDLNFSFFAIRTLERSYLLENERPQFLWMRVAVAIHFPNLEGALNTYELMSKREFTHATPTLCNAGLKENAQLASCFLLGIKSTDIGDIFECLKECALISHSVGGIGLHCSNITARSNKNNGIVPLLRVFNNASRYVSQGTNKRPGAISITLEPWHADVYEFLDLRKNHGKEEYRARDLFYALWVPNIFMEKVLKNEKWHLFSPERAPNLQNVYGKEFEDLYNKYVSENRFSRVVDARHLWDKICEAQIETGNPSLLYKDSCNAKSNQQNLGTIKSSNLCTEIIEFSSDDEIAVCNLASISLPSCINDGKFNFQKLHKLAKTVTSNLNLCIDRTSYPLPQCENSNKKNRPIAVGVQGLADVYFQLQMAFDSDEACEINFSIFETIYHGCLEASMELAQIKKETYASYKGSPLSKGKLQLDFWDFDSTKLRWDWNTLRSKIQQHGTYNSLVTSVMPTASTAQILGNIESVEPIMSNLFSRRTLSGEFQLVNHYLVAELEKLNLWTKDIRELLIAHRGSIQDIDGIPSSIKNMFKTAFELSMKSVIEQSAARAPFIDQSQSMNLFLAKPTIKQLTSMHFHAYKKGLKTGIYYLRTQPATDPIPFTISPKIRSLVEEKQNERSQKRLKIEHCDVCSS